MWLLHSKDKKQAAYDSRSRLDWVRQSLTCQTQQASNAPKEHPRMSTSTPTHERDVEADDMNSYQRDTDLTF